MMMMVANCVCNDGDGRDEARRTAEAAAARTTLSRHVGFSPEK